ncbi:Ataxin-3 [Psilocybe cubensis]|uniref:Ataxin-3 n=1 Tax=Psilocybe cubensis TaxID=181762 RepID=A0ACB8HBS9_PSICU|nr:Ataxin-3 [Psilocybe cubensis]KAH9485378.1 Ataxin-3 [Psilocybe cubensis]
MKGSKKGLCCVPSMPSILFFFTAPDLSDIARSLDSLEESYDDSNTGQTSTNMDDTDSRILENKPHKMARRRNASIPRSPTTTDMIGPYLRTQLAFILNLEQHWFTLRRFGKASPNIDLDEGDGHWFNLNSFLPAPEWVGKLYLGMVLQQAETEGYSVFAVTQANPDAPLALPRTEADIIASTLPEPTSATSSVRLRTSHDTVKHTNTLPAHSGDLNLDEEDLELQAALQASLMGVEQHGEVEENEEDDEGLASAVLSPVGFGTPQFQHTLRSATSAVGSGSRTSQPPSFSESPDSGQADLDPIAASMERNRFLLQRMKRQQEFAQREMWSESDLTPEEQIALAERRERRRRQEEEEEEELRRAIEESQALAEEQRLGKGRDPMDVDSPSKDYLSTSNFVTYDDGDAELQAALKASLEHPLSQQAQTSTSTDDAESVLSDTTSAMEDVSASATTPTLDEIRQRRLARFG